VGTLGVMVSGPKRPLFLAAACSVLFVAVMVAAYWVPVVRWADGWAVGGFLNLQSPWLSPIAYHVGKLADPLPFALATLLIAIVALYRRRPRHAIAAVLFLLGSNVVAQTLKPLLAIDRTHAFLGDAQVHSSSFPSGHATASMGLALAAILVSASRWRPYVAIAGALFALAVSESIMLLAWHFPSDVIGGFLVATFCALVTVAGLRAAEQRWPEHSGREAARRAFSTLDLRRVALTVGAFVVAALGGVAVAAGAATLNFADRHTTAVFAAVAVAAVAAAVPVSVAAFGARRS
jgi:membrane-associated phospholipid phosphatase